MVERLLSAVEGLDRRSHADSAIHEAIEREDSDAFDEEHQRMTDGDNTAQIAWAQLGRPLVPWPPAVGRTELLIEAERFLAEVGDPDAALRLTNRIDSYRP